MKKKYKVTVRGTGQLNGPVIINKTIELDDHVMAYKFMGGDRYVVFEDFVKTYYPGVKVNPKDLAANVQVIEEKENRKSTVNKYDDEPKRTKEKVSRKKDNSLTSILTGMAVGAVLNAINDKQSKKKDDENEIDERIEAAERKSADKKVRNKIYNEISSVIDFDFSNSLSNIQNNMDKLLFALVSLNSLKYSESSKLYQNRLAQKYKFGLIRLKAIENTEKLYSYYRRRYWQINIKRIFFQLFNSID